MVVKEAVSVFVGAGFGACLRWALSLWLGGAFQAPHLGTLAANLVGCFLAGMASALFAARADLPPELRLLAVTGFLGGLTTFSAFSTEIHALAAASRHLPALLTLFCNLAGSLLMAAAGYWLYNRLWG